MACTRSVNAACAARNVPIRSSASTHRAYAGQGKGAALEDLGQTPGCSGQGSLVPGPYVPSQMGEADVQLVAVVAGGGVAEGAGPGPHARVPEQSGQRAGRGDPGVERCPEAAPGGIEEEVAARRALPGQHRLDP